MFYSQIILAKKGPLGKVWLAAHWDRKLTKQQIYAVDIAQKAEQIMEPEVPLALRVSGHLLLGLVRIYATKMRYMVNDSTEARFKIQSAFSSASVDLKDDGVVSGNAVNVANFGEFDDAIPDGIDDLPQGVDDEWMEVTAQSRSRVEDITLDETDAGLGGDSMHSGAHDLSFATFASGTPGRVGGGDEFDAGLGAFDAMDDDVQQVEVARAADTSRQSGALDATPLSEKRLSLAPSEHPSEAGAPEAAEIDNDADMSFPQADPMDASEFDMQLDDGEKGREVEEGASAKPVEEAEAEVPGELNLSGDLDASVDASEAVASQSRRTRKAARTKYVLVQSQTIIPADEFKERVNTQQLPPNEFGRVLGHKMQIKQRVPTRRQLVERQRRAVEGSSSARRSQSAVRPWIEGVAPELEAFFEAQLRPPSKEELRDARRRAAAAAAAEDDEAEDEQRGSPGKRARLDDTAEELRFDDQDLGPAQGLDDDLEPAHGRRSMLPGGEDLEDLEPLPAELDDNAGLEANEDIEGLIPDDDLALDGGEQLSNEGLGGGAGVASGSDMSANTVRVCTMIRDAFADAEQRGEEPKTTYNHLRADFAGQRQSVAACFFEILALKSLDAIEVEQSDAFGDIVITPADGFDATLKRAEKARRELGNGIEEESGEMDDDDDE